MHVVLNFLGKKIIAVSIFICILTWVLCFAKFASIAKLYWKAVFYWLRLLRFNSIVDLCLGASAVHVDYEQWCHQFESSWRPLLHVLQYKCSLQHVHHLNESVYLYVQCILRRLEEVRAIQDVDTVLLLTSAKSCSGFRNRCSQWEGPYK